MYKQLILNTVLWSCLVSIPAHAVEHFNGGYAILQGGVSTVKGSAGARQIKKHGAILGIGFGYNKTIPQNENIVLGIEVYAADHKYTGSESHNHTNSYGEVSHHTTTISPSHHVGISAKLGYKVKPDTMVYALAGVERVTVNRTTRFTAPGDAEFNSDKVNMTAVMLGGGFETMVSEKVSARVQYEHSLPKSVPTVSRTKKHNWSYQRLMVGVAYHF